jgi:small GTP-binding protein
MQPKQYSNVYGYYSEKLKMASPDFFFKVVIIGDAGVGKTALLSQVVDSQFDLSYTSTIGVDFKSTCLDVNGKCVKLNMWDAAGQERFRTLTSSYYRNAHGIVIVYSVNHRPSFHSIQTWWEEIQHYAGENTVIMLVGNKNDLSREVTVKEGQALAEYIGCEFAETSAKDHTRSMQVFQKLAESILKTNPPEGIVRPAPLNLEIIEPKMCPNCCLL